MKNFILAATLALGLSGPTHASSECSDAVDSYNSALEEVGYTLKRYARCVENSGGSDDCSSEFRRLKNSQYDFETAVSSYGSECG